MTVLVISIPIMVLALAIAVVPLIVAIIGVYKQRDRADASAAVPARTEHFPASSVPRTGSVRSGDPTVAAGPRARFF
jgi:hypothetical protein